MEELLAVSISHRFGHATFVLFVLCWFAFVACFDLIVCFCFRFGFVIVLFCLLICFLLYVEIVLDMHFHLGIEVIVDIYNHFCNTWPLSLFYIFKFCRLIWKEIKNTTGFPPSG